MYNMFIFITDALELQVPKYILPQDNFTVTCRSSKPLTITVKHCNIIYRSFQRHKGRIALNFLVAHVHVGKECEVTCHTSGQKVTKIISVIGKDIAYMDDSNIFLTDGVITSQYCNVTVSKGIAFTLTCSSKCKSGSCEVVWTTDKMSVFVRNDKDHTIWSTPPYKHVQTHYLTVHSASSSTSYHCLLIAITGKILNSAEQRVYIKEPGE